MTKTGFRFFLNLAGILLVIVVISSASPPTFAQLNQNQRPSPLGADEDQDERRHLTSIEEEMRTKRQLRYAEQQYQENLDRARDLSVLSEAIVRAYREKHTLGNEDVKKLEKVEKLAKGIRSAAGGSEDDTKMEKPPADMDSAVKMLGTLSHSLKEQVEKTPKRVISAVVIDQANVLLELVRIVRRLPPKV